MNTYDRSTLITRELGHDARQFLYFVGILEDLESRDMRQDVKLNELLLTPKHSQVWEEGGRHRPTDFLGERLDRTAWGVCVFTL